MIQTSHSETVKSSRHITTNQKCISNGSHHLFDKLKHFLLFQIDKDHIDIPQKDIMLLQHKMKDNITIKTVEISLKYFRMQKYYDNIPQIYCMLTKKELPLLLQNECDLVVDMCLKSKKIFFKKYVPEGRNSFLNWSFILHKVLNIIQRSDVADFFKMTINPTKRKFYEGIWQKICAYLDWPYSSD